MDYSKTFMDIEEINAIYHSALQRWGIEPQLKMAIEECAELIQAICHTDRNRPDKCNLAEEIADVEIMCGQLHNVQYFKTKKILKLKKKLDTGGTS
jgi:NTP pyrophosphatase (non-canonical NTP hydrolase)